MSKKVKIVANKAEHVDYDEFSDYIGVDGGCLFCLQHNLAMKYAIGDFDSINQQEKETLQKTCECIVLPKEKDVVDTEYAIAFAHEKGYEQIEVFGVTGGRQDHFLAIFQMLKKKDISFSIIDNQNIIYRLEKGTHRIEKKMDYLSFYPCENTTISIQGVKYPLDYVTVSEKDTYLVSNEIIGAFATLEVDQRIIVIQSKS